MRAALVVAVLAGLVAIATGEVTTMLTQDQQAALTTIDTLPSKAQLQGAQLVVPDDLITIAADAEQEYEPAVRLRAIHGLAVYCASPGTTCPEGSQVHTTLAALIAANVAAHSGSDLVLLRAAIESIGPLKDPDDVQRFRDWHLLDHPSRDIRAATARSLADMQACTAVNDLRIRYQNESTEQVKLVISETLRTLSTPSICP